ncbi:MAG: hypothetical protein AAGU02_02740 [Lawsonibacter sp.]
MKHIKQKAAGLITAAMLSVTTAWAEDFGDSKLATGSVNLVHDVTTWLLVLCPLAGGAAALVFLIRRGMADEQDGKMWNTRILVSIICGVAGFVVSGVINMLSSYYK